MQFFHVTWTTNKCFFTFVCSSHRKHHIFCCLQFLCYFEKRCYFALENNPVVIILFWHFLTKNFIFQLYYSASYHSLLYLLIYYGGWNYFINTYLRYHSKTLVSEICYKYCIVPRNNFFLNIKKILFDLW